MALVKDREITEGSTENKGIRTKSQMDLLHKRYNISTSSYSYIEFIENTQLWNEYHEISEKNEKSFYENEIPRNEIIQELYRLVIKRNNIVV